MPVIFQTGGPTLFGQDALEEAHACEIGLAKEGKPPVFRTHRSFLHQQFVAAGEALKERYDRFTAELTAAQKRFAAKYDH